MDKIIQILVKRFKSKSPKAYAKATNWSLVIGAIAGIVLLLPVSLPAWVVSVLGLLITITTAFSSGTKLTTEDEQIKKETKEIFSAYTAKSRRQSTSGKPGSKGSK